MVENWESIECSFGRKGDGDCNGEQRLVCQVLLCKLGLSRLNILHKEGKNCPQHHHIFENTAKVIDPEATVNPIF